MDIPTGRTLSKATTPPTPALAIGGATGTMLYFSGAWYVTKGAALFTVDPGGGPMPDAGVEGGTDGGAADGAPPDEDGGTSSSSSSSSSSGSTGDAGDVGSPGGPGDGGDGGGCTTTGASVNPLAALPVIAALAAMLRRRLERSAT